jgi:hypothetical protein
LWGKCKKNEIPQGGSESKGKKRKIKLSQRRKIYARGGGVIENVCIRSKY